MFSFTFVCVSVCVSVIGIAQGQDECIMTSQDLMPARNAGLSSHRPEKLNNSKFTLSKFSQGR
jgi:hypothetical protein